ncbi:hypothetical protein [Streptomyces tricolor]|uniref:hypothetical protein n=1 Tax=Streptomyces tricolor TaxID=68277 RepID=UPI0036E58620
MATPDTAAITQDFVTESIRAVFGDDFDTTVERWVPAHADLNWANATAPLGPAAFASSARRARSRLAGTPCRMAAIGGMRGGVGVSAREPKSSGAATGAAW